MEAIVVALIAAGPATIAALASWRASKRTEKEMVSPNGIRTGDILYATYKNLAEHAANTRIHHEHTEV